MERKQKWLALICAIPLLLMTATSWGLSDRQVMSRFKVLNKKINQIEERFRLNGFFTAGFTQSDAEQGYYDGTDDKANFEADSILGLQFEFKLNEKATLVAQTVSEGKENFNSEMEWAFLKYELTPGLELRGGRLRLPAYMLSEYIQVGFAYPWITPPQEVYGTLPFTAYEGVDMVWYKIIGDFDIRFQPFYGSIRFTRNDTGQFALDAAGNELKGFDLRIGRGNFNLRLGALETKVNFEDEFPAYAGIGAAISNTRTFQWLPTYTSLLATEGGIDQVQTALLNEGQSAANAGTYVGLFAENVVPSLFTPGSGLNTDLASYEADLVSALQALPPAGFAPPGAPTQPADPEATAALIMDTFLQTYNTAMSLPNNDFVALQQLQQQIPDLDLEEPNATARFSGIGFTYDNGNWMLMGEGVRSEFEGAQADQDAWFFTIAKRFGAFTPHLTVSEVESTDDENRELEDLYVPDTEPTFQSDPSSPSVPCSTVGETVSADCFVYSKQQVVAGALNRTLQSIAANQRSVTLGVRWDFAPGMAMKMDLTQVSDFANSYGFFDDPIASATTLEGLTATPLLEEDDPEINLIRIAVDAVF